MKNTTIFWEMIRHLSKSLREVDRKWETEILGMHGAR